MPAAVRREAAHYGELLGICALAISQPILDVFSKAPEQFAFRGASTSDIVAFPILVVVVPAAVLWLPGALTRFRSEDAGRLLHHAAVAAALYLGLLQALHEALGVGGLWKAALAASGAGAGLWLFRRFDGVRLWTRVLSLYALLLVGLFLFASPAGELAFAAPPDVVDLVVDDGAPEGDDDPSGDATDSGAALPDIVMIVLDEVPTGLLLDESGGIDRLRYPRMAELADGATWYRRHTSVSADTVTAIPTLLSGQLPSDGTGPLWTQQPDNLFRLLGGAYHLTVSEAVTRLCPDAWCDQSPIPPPPPTTAALSDDAGSEATPPPASPPPAADLDRGGLSSLLGDATDLWTDQIALDRDDQLRFEGFEETGFVPAPLDDTGTPTATDTPEPGLDDLAPPDVPETSPDEVDTIERNAAFTRYFGVFDRQGQAPRVDQFRAALTPSPRPTLYFLHVVLPHQPFVFTETGQIYEGPSYADATSADWDEVVLAERMSLQMQFTDGLVGDILDDLRAAGIYDDALVVVTGDHGASLDRSKEWRTYDGTNASELLVTPLLIKAPGQSEAVVSDAPIESVDLVPTIADLLGIEVPWPVDGDSGLGSPPDFTDAGCGDTRRLIPDGDEWGDEPIELCAEDVVPAGLRPMLAPVRPSDPWATTNLARRSPFPDMLGRPWSELAARPGGTTFTLDDPDPRRGASPPLGIIEGSVADTRAQWVAVGINGQVAGISPLYDRQPDDGVDRPEHFAIVVPSPLLDEDGYDVLVATLETVDGDVVATELTGER